MLHEIGSIEQRPGVHQARQGAAKGGSWASATASTSPTTRAPTIIKRIADLVFEVTGKNPLLEIALELERIALEDEYFVSRKLYPNVDFYSGLIYQAMGFPVDMFPVLFAIPRTAGWIAQWEEMLHRSGAEDRAPAADLHRSGQARLRLAGEAQVGGLGVP